MSSDALARKYRPRCLDDLVGQESVVKTLKNALEKNKLQQAYLLVGAFGCGKTSAARIIAASENCLISPGLHPCGTCNLCKGIFEGIHTDVEEVDAAGKFAKVEEVRKLKAASAYASTDGAKKKYYIIDEVHRLSDSAADSLLKILEEPPPHVRFILCTTDVNKLREAVQSRCQRHDFSKIYWRQIKEHLEKVAKLEKITIEDTALNMCAKMSKGSMRNSLFLLEKLIAYAGSEAITAKHAETMFGTPEETAYYDLLDETIGLKGGKPDATNAFRIINHMLSSGVDPNNLYDGIAEHLKDLMIGLSSSKAGEFLSLSETGKVRLAAQLSKVKEKEKLNAVLQSLSKLHDARRAMDVNLSPETAFQQWLLESIFLFRS